MGKVMTTGRARRAARPAAWGIAALLASAAPALAQDGLFNGMEGAWRGEGTIGWTTGEIEKMRCNAKYEVADAGNSIVQNLTCATDSTRLVVKSTIKYNPAANALSGSWSETGYGINGYVTGRASTGNVRAIVESTDKRFTAIVTISMNGPEQTVTIAPDGIDVTEVAVTMRRPSSS